ncbi:MAG: hypothetical protein HZA54_04905 [Planctomycetes bacterium]|nr:hypothetical protein [Planctomycetota bacterium]
MSDVISTEFGLLVSHGKLDECICRLEGALRALRTTPFHRVLGRDFLHHTRAAAKYLIEFHQSAPADTKLAALYFEMNGFTINPDRWYCDGFGYRTAGDIWELDWLATWDAETAEQFTLEGMESAQQAFADLHGDEKQSLAVQLAGELAEHLVTARFMQLIAAAHKSAKRRYGRLKGLPVLATAHEWDTVHQTT